MNKKLSTRLKSVAARSDSRFLLAPLFNINMIY